MQTPHNFKDQLAYSEKSSDEPFWMQVYRKAFPGMVNAMMCSGDHATQREGIDRLILLNSGRVLKIDEKKRKGFYTDIALEYLSNDQTKAPGWIEKNLTIDYLAYAFMPTQTVYLLDWLTLRRAWKANGEAWKQKHFIVKAKNAGYTTYSVAVPITTLLQSMNEALVVKLNAQDIEIVKREQKDKAA